MTTAIFTGTIRPEWQGVIFEVGDPFKVTLTNDAGGAATIAFRLAYSQLSIIVKTANDVVELGAFRNEVFATVRPFVDLVGYFMGQVVAFDIPSVTFVEQDQLIVFLEAVPGIHDQPQDRPLSVQTMFPVVMQYPHIGRALADLRGAVEMFNDTPFYTYRVVEDVMQFFVADDDRPAAWQRLRDSLRIDRTFLQPLESASKFSRHGQLRVLTGAERIDLMKRAWQVVDRFAVFLHRGASEPLPAGEYALLS